MSTEQVRSFLNAVSNDRNLKARAEKMTWEQVHHLATGQGHSFSLDDLLGVVRQGGELSDGELDGVAGGTTGGNQALLINVDAGLEPSGGFVSSGPIPNQPVGGIATEENVGPNAVMSPMVFFGGGL